MSNLPEVIEAPLELLAENFSATIPDEEHDCSEMISPEVLRALSEIEEADPTPAYDPASYVHPDEVLDPEFIRVV
jgi:hypothetical protein